MTIFFRMSNRISIICAISTTVRIFKSQGYLKSYLSTQDYMPKQLLSFLHIKGLKGLIRLFFTTQLIYPHVSNLLTEYHDAVVLSEPSVNALTSQEWPTAYTVSENNRQLNALLEPLKVLLRTFTCGVCMSYGLHYPQIQTARRTVLAFVATGNYYRERNERHYSCSILRHTDLLLVLVRLTDYSRRRQCAKGLYRYTYQLLLQQVLCVNNQVR